MKKITTSLFALAVAVSAVALPLQKTASVAPDFKLAKNLDPMSASMLTQKHAKLDTDFVPFSLKNSGITTKALPEGATSTIYYTNPSGTFYPVQFFSLDGEEGWYIPSILVPPYANLDWLNYSYYLATDAEGNESLGLIGSEYTYNWTYYDFNGSQATSDTENLTTYNQPMPLKGFPEVAPTLTANGDANLTYENHFVVYGGDGKYGDQFIAANEGMTDLIYQGACPVDMLSNDFANFGRTGAFGNGAATAAGWADWENYYVQYYGITDFSIEGVAQIINKPASPYALKNLTVYAYVQCAAGADINFTFFKLNDQGQVTSEVAKEYTYTFDQATDNVVAISIPFTSLDAYGWELDYQLIDYGMAMFITGYDDAAFTTFDLPVLFFKYDSPTWIVNGTSLYAYATFMYNGSQAGDLLDYPYVFHTDETKTALMGVASMYILMDMEYPYLQTYGNYTTGEGYEPKAEYTVGAYAGGSVEIGMLCSAYASDIVYDTADGSDIPSWLTVEITDNTSDYSGLTAEDVIVKFSVDANVEDVNHTCDIVLSYKGQTQTFHVNHYSSSVENIGNDAVETVESEYYNLQGQKLVAAPQNGIFIQKNIKADGSVQNVKVVK